MRQALRLRWRPQDSKPSFMIISSARIHGLFKDSEVPRIYQGMLHMQYKWYKAAFDMTWFQADGKLVYPLRELMLIRTPRMWSMAQAVGAELDAANVEGWRRRIPGPFTHWSSGLQTAFGNDREDWLGSSSMQQWMQHSKAYVRKLCGSWVFPPPMYRKVGTSVIGPDTRDSEDARAPKSKARRFPGPDF